MVSPSRLMSGHNGNATKEIDMNITTSTRTSLLRSCAALGVVAIAMVGLAGTAAAAVPTHPAAAIRVGMSDSDSITDLTPFDMQLTNATQQPGPYGNGWMNGEYPSQNEVHAGYGSNWGITNWVESNLSSYYNQPWNVQYQFTDTTGSTDTVTMALPQQSPAGTAGTCTITGNTADNYTCGTNGTNQFYVAAANPQNLSQANRDQFAQGLANLCNGPHSANGKASCSFTPAADTFRYFTDSHGFTNQANTQTGCYKWIDGQPNPNDENSFSMEQSTSETNSISDSLTESVEAGIDGVATAGISNSTTWGHEFTHGVSYSNTKQVAANYGEIATPVWFPTDAAITGNFTATLGGTTYTLDGVTLTSTGVTGAIIDGHQIGQSVATVQQYPMNAAQWNQFCPGLTPPATVTH